MAVLADPADLWSQAAEDLVRAEFDAIIEANRLPPCPRPRRGHSGPDGRRRHHRDFVVLRQRIADDRCTARQRSPPPERTGQ